MAIELACPACRQKYRLNDSLAGKKAKCAKCGESIRVPAPVLAITEPLPDLSDLFDDAFPVAAQSSKPGPQSQPAVKSAVGSNCPNCSAALEKSAVLCVKCGYNTRTREKLSTKREAAAQPSSKSKKGSKSTLVKGSLFSFIGAMIGTGVWVGIALATGYEIGYIAWGLGAAAGVGMAIGHDDDDGTTAGIIAAAMSIMGILAAKGIIFEQFQNQLADLGIGGEELAKLEAVIGESISFSSMFSPIDGLFILLAVGSAYKLGSGQSTD